MFQFDEDDCMQVCPHHCPVCRNKTTYYTGWWTQIDEQLGKMAKVVCPVCEYGFVFILASLDPDKAWMFKRKKLYEKWDDEDRGHNYFQ